MPHSPEEEYNLRLVQGLFANVLEPLNSARVDDYIDEGYIQHNQSVEPGREALKAFLDLIRGQNPGSTHDIKRMFVDGDHVIVHYHVRRWPDDTGWAVCDIFRIENGKIKEHWDVLQNVETGGPNPNSPF